MSIQAMEMLKMSKSSSYGLFSSILQWLFFYIYIFITYLWEHNNIHFIGFDTNMISPLFFFFCSLGSSDKICVQTSNYNSFFTIGNRNYPQDNNCPSTNPPISPDSMPHLIRNITQQRRRSQQRYAFRGTLDTFIQSEGGPVSSTDGKMNGWTRGCQDKEGVRGQTAAGRHLSWETSTTRQQRKRGESGQLLLLREDTLRNEWLRNINCPTKSGFRHAEWTVTMNPQRDPSKDTIWFPVKAAVHCPVMSVITQNVFKLTNVSLPLNDHWLYKVPFYPASH